ncbi:ATP-binding protein [Caballeronia sp.]|uniref:hybrid sensor histidine kinase/response regulator n=1 Tax=Caballeronia sp. TaxID=1931223 RepID=UPI003C5CB333
MKATHESSSLLCTAGSPSEGAPSRLAVESVERARAAGVIITAALAQRPTRPPQLLDENAALVSLTRALTAREGTLLPLLANTALTLCNADSSGISLVDCPIHDNSRFTWVAAAGISSPYACASTPVYDSPCGITVALGEPQLFGLPQRYFEALRGPIPEVIEGLVVEIPIGSGATGTIWVMSHRGDRQFDLEDVRVLTSLANFAGAALTVIRARKEAAEQAANAVTAREALEQSEANRENFIAMLGHELRNPMSPIDSAIAAAKLACSDNEKVTTILAVAQRQMQQLRTLVDDLLDATRIRHGKFVLKCCDVSLEAIVSDAISAARYDIDGRGHRLVVSSVDRPACVYVDHVRMSQLLGNLLSNASKYTPAGGIIELNIEIQPYTTQQAVVASRFIGDVLVTVRDNGVGIDAFELPNVFDMFKQTASSNGRAEGGLGIGLAVAKRMVELHDGTIDIKSEGHGRGTTVELRLPILVNTPEKASHPRTASSRPTKVLLVDDNLDALEAVGMLLELQGHQVRTAANATSALSVAHDFLPEVALIDIGMPGTDGFQLAQQFRAQTKFDETILVALTGFTAEAEVARGRAAGFDLHLTKPLSVEELHRFLAERAAQPADGADACSSRPC